MKVNYFQPSVTSMLTEREAQRRLAKEVADLLTHQPEENLHWNGTTIDLMEALYIACTSYLIVDDESNALPFTRIADEACKILHRHRPVNIHKIAQRGSCRKGVQQYPYITRYRHLVNRDPNCQPFMEKVVPIPPKEDVWSKIKTVLTNK